MINGERVRQARELRCLTQSELASRIGVSQSAIAQVETGRINSTDEVQQGIVLQTGFPLAFFRQSTSTDFPLGSLLFRARSSVTLRERREAHQYARIIFEIVEGLEPYLTKIPIRIPHLSGDPAEAAKHTRSALGFSPDAPIPNLINSLEKAGVLILAIPTILKKRDAFSAWVVNDTPRPVIAISLGNTGDRLRFSVAHELGHLVLHQAVKGDLANVEHDANRFTGEFLMPEEAMQHEIVPPVNLLSLAKLKPRWGVSIQALIRRAYDIKIITERQYKYLMQQLSIRGWRKREPRNLDVRVERPRALSKMAELIYGVPVDYKRLASDMNLPQQIVKEAIEANGGKASLGGTVESTRASNVRDLDSFRQNL